MSPMGMVCAPNPLLGFPSIALRGYRLTPLRIGVALSPNIDACCVLGLLFTLSI